MKPTKNFKMRSQTKTMLALMCKTKNERDHYKAMMIQAQLASEVKNNSEKKSIARDV
jgi:hypothetical protein